MKSQSIAQSSFKSSFTMKGELYLQSKLWNEELVLLSQSFI